MIIRHIPMKTARLSSFSGLVAYITNPQDKQERVGRIRISNCSSIDPAWAVQEVLATQAKNQRAKADKTYHLLISFAPGEYLSDERLHQIEERIISSIGFKEHQRISTVHHDTDNLHIHVAINKIHPKTLNMIEPYRAYKTFAQVATELEIEFGLKVTNHQSRKSHSENLADDMEHHSGIESFINWMKRHCTDAIEAADSWSEVHQVLASHGVIMKLRGNGFVFCDKHGLMIKASSVSRQFSKQHLLSRLGAFIPTSLQDEPLSQNTYRYEPLHQSKAHATLYARYREERQNNKTLLSGQLKTLRLAKTKAITQAKKRASLKRAALKLMKMPVIQKKYLYSKISQTLLEEIDHIRTNYTKQRQRQIDGLQNRTWADWLRHKAESGERDALTALRLRNRKNKGQYTLSGSKGAVFHGSLKDMDSITKEGTVIIKVDKAVIRTNGHEIAISKGGSIDTLKKALELAQQHYGNCIRVNGSALFKKIILHIVIQNNISITFADSDMEAQRVKLKQEYKNEPTKRQRYGTGTRAVRHDEAVAATAGRIRGASTAKPNAERTRRGSPTENQNSLRDVSQLDVVQFTRGSEVLLPDHAHDKLERQGLKSDNHVRWQPGRLKKTGKGNKNLNPY
ncbi:TPA: TraI/MobA(P) family conjugative relaxase [Legionella pneumophila]|uniref:TraI/MobA(P) family conjugative relaxase n=1 Tax=Legionella pneumophila TaxID=446 RepID=UPI001A20DBCD|nr:TraI/MobA(P) family conjugative relaxase [Legionella pneumophila]MCZ4682193.1 relaxase/mobilization nuclease domain-containing protein [Legionella pneumophila]HAU0949077.1 relaxase/mobilization nuclease domain-containing protein [Legionella pneumophila]HAU1288283.1 relaxase/mobilization nuclease domain-containing protein [Legionella pneumophila]